MTRLHQALYGVALALACACVVVGVLIFFERADSAKDTATQDRYGEVMAAASAEAEAFVNIDYRDPEATFEAVAEGATGDFRDQYETVSAELVELLTASESVMTGEVVNVAVSNLDEDSARVLVSTSGTVTNTAVEESQSESARSFRLALQLVRVDGEWLTDDLEFVG